MRLPYCPYLDYPEQRSKVKLAQLIVLGGITFPESPLEKSEVPRLPKPNADVMEYWRQHSLELWNEFATVQNILEEAIQASILRYDPDVPMNTFQV